MIAAIREAVNLLPSVARRPPVVACWLAEAHRAQIALGLFLLLALFGLPTLLDWVLPRLYPVVETQHKLLGIFKHSTTKPDPRLDARRRQLTILIWGAGLGTVATLLLAALPVAVAHAQRQAWRLGEEADSLVDHGDPARSIPLYQSALGLTLDADHDAALRERLRVVEGRAAMRDAAPSTVFPDGELRALRAAETIFESGPRCVGAGNRYRLTKEIGRGGMGVVYHAVDTALEREVALKELPLHLCAQGELTRRFRQEVRLLARLSHPCIVQVHDLIEDRGRLWIALELVNGGNLADAMQRRGGALPWEEVVRLASQMAEGLAFAHARRVVHRDIKPLNVLLTDDLAPAAKLTDFGLARLLESTDHTQIGALLGSARYMSPEQVGGRPADGRSDIYSLGITLFEMLCGRAPFEGDVASVLAQHLSGTPPAVGELCPGLPPALATLVMSMLARPPEDRPRDVDSIARALRALSA